MDTLSGKLKIKEGGHTVSIKP